MVVLRLVDHLILFFLFFCLIEFFTFSEKHIFWEKFFLYIDIVFSGKKKIIVYFFFGFSFKNLQFGQLFVYWRKFFNNF